MLPILAMLPLALCGCASPGFPRPPSLHLPAPVTDLTARRVLSRVELHWAAPTATTDGLDLTMPTMVEVCRDKAALTSAALTSESTSPPCTVVVRVGGHSGPSSATDYLPAELSSEPARQLLAYRVRVVNPAGRFATPTVTAIVPSGPPPLPVEAFRAVQEKNGVRLEWKIPSGGTSGPTPPAGKDIVEVLRTDLNPTPDSTSGNRITAATAKAKPSATNPPNARRPEGPPAELRLRAEAAGRAAGASTLEGMIDQSAMPDGTYSYRAQRVISVKQNGKTFDIFSEPTPAIIISMRDTFPPGTPQGLASIPGPAAQLNGSDPRPSIDLSWLPDSSVDLAGYFVYRTDVTVSAPSGDPNPVRLTPSPVPAPAFRDTTVVAGHRYSYRVTAIDRSGNESAPSAAIEDTPEGR